MVSKIVIPRIVVVYQSFDVTESFTRTFINQQY